MCAHNRDLAWVPTDGRPGHLRFVALGDSATCGFGDRDPSGMRRGWARLLADAIAQDHSLSFCNLAVVGSTVRDVRRDQLRDALEHQAHLASLIVGLNDTVRSTWNPPVIRADLLHCAQRLSEQGAVLLTVRFHDHARVFHLRGPLGRPLRARIDFLNQVYDEIHERYGGLRVDLAAQPGIYDREFWSVDRLHPSELGHRALAHEFTSLLHDAGLLFEPAGLELDGASSSTWHKVGWMMSEVVPWLGRRTRDLAPAIACSWINAGRDRLPEQLPPPSAAASIAAAAVSRLRPARP